MNLQITSDFICPWCWIGESNLDRALSETGLDDSVQVHFVPYQLNPDMPAQGMNRRDYRTAKFGSWARSQAMDAQVTQAGVAAGLVFNYERIEKTPNTFAAHRLVWRQQQTGVDARPLVREIFRAYFALGLDIGEPAVLADIASAFNYDREETLRFLASSEGVAELAREQAEARRAGVQSVPSIRIDEQILSGAQPVSVFSQVLKTVTRFL